MVETALRRRGTSPRPANGGRGRGGQGPVLTRKDRIAGGLVGMNKNGSLVSNQSVTAGGFGNYAKYTFGPVSATNGDVIRVWMYSSAISGNPGHYVVIDDAALTK